MINGMIKTASFLFTVAAISGVLLAFSESITSPIIKANQLKAEIEAQNLVLPSHSFVDVKLETLNCKVGLDKEGKVTGAVFKVAPKGFGGDINTMVGIDTSGNVKGYKILSLTETPGLGSKLTSEKFQSDLDNLIITNPNPNFKVKKDGGDVDAITAATISSRAFCEGLQEAKASFNQYKEQILKNQANKDFNFTNLQTSEGSQK